MSDLYTTKAQANNKANNILSLMLLIKTEQQSQPSHDDTVHPRLSEPPWPRALKMCSDK